MQSAMQSADQDFADFLAAIRDAGPSEEEDKERIALFPEDRPARRELSIPLHPVRGSEGSGIHRDFLSHGNHGEPVKVFKTLERGLAANGWYKIPKTSGRRGSPGVHRTPPEAFLGEGAFGVVMLAYMRSQDKVPLEHRHLSAVKVQPNPSFEDAFLSRLDLASAWTEIDVLRGCVHPNIVAYYGHFAVGDVMKAKEIKVAILLEYASAGDLECELSRYIINPLDEPGARYYARQFIAGLSYLHRKFVTHNDLHVGNVVLRYNRDCSKTAMITDFGSAVVYDADKVRTGDVMFDTRHDILSVNQLVMHMIRSRLPPSPRAYRHEVKQMFDLTRTTISNLPNWSLDEMLQQFSWFKGRTDAPYPKTPTPLLNAATIARMGYENPPVMRRQAQARRRAVTTPAEAPRRSSPREWANVSLYSLAEPSQQYLMQLNRPYFDQSFMQPAAPAGFPSMTSAQLPVLPTITSSMHSPPATLTTPAAESVTRSQADPRPTTGSWPSSSPALTVESPDIKSAEPEEARVPSPNARPACKPVPKPRVSVRRAAAQAMIDEAARRGLHFVGHCLQARPSQAERSDGSHERSSSRLSSTEAAGQSPLVRHSASPVAPVTGHQVVEPSSSQLHARTSGSVPDASVQPSLGQRMRRSVTGIARRINCFRPRDRGSSH